MSGETILRGLVLVLFMPVIGGTVAYLIGHPLKAMVWNGVVPLLVFIASALAFLNNPTQITVAGLLYFAFPLAVLLACAVGLRLRRVHPALFWFTWAVNAAILAFLFYLSFFFKIF